MGRVTSIMRCARFPWTERVVLGLTLAAFTVSSIGWDLAYRRNQPFDIDESGYLKLSLNDLHGLTRGGLFGWVRAVEAPVGQAPLMTAATTPLYLVFGHRAMAALLAPLLFSLITIAVTFALARRG
ncbi:MAG: hypothetical protein JWO57_3317 [Pseudonocardiales bacterium]|nr:hypothetical protein [Pseudonocardiales bacterium]